jgi:2-desacetyl-2-hydroxyethyl bacteriochlorophyllide A dehydrogenase
MLEARYALIPDKERLCIETERLDVDRLGRDQVLVRAEASIVSAGTELAAFTALSKNVYIPGRWNSYPFRPGYGLVGRVEAVGETSGTLGAGQRVLCFGKHASLQIYDFSGDKPMSGIFSIEEDLPAEQAVVARMALVALAAPQTAEAEPGDTVAVFGLGLVGNLAAQLYQIAGARVIALDTSRGRCHAARECGLETVLDVAPDQQARAVLDHTRGRGATIVVDAVGHSAVIQTALRAVAAHGEIILLGSPRVPVESNVTDVFNRIHMQWLTLRGALEWRLPRHPTRGLKHSVASNLALALDLIRSGRLRVAPIVSHLIRVEQLLDAYRGMLSDKDRYLGVVIDWR